MTNVTLTGEEVKSIVERIHEAMDKILKVTEMPGLGKEVDSLLFSAGADLAMVCDKVSTPEIFRE